MECTGGKRAWEEGQSWQEGGGSGELEGLKGSAVVEEGQTSMAGSVGQPKQKYWWMGALAEKCGRALRQNGWIFGVPGAQTNLDLPGTYSFPGIPSYTWG